MTLDLHHATTDRQIEQATREELLDEVGTFEGARSAKKARLVELTKTVRDAMKQEHEAGLARQAAIRKAQIEAEQNNPIINCTLCAAAEGIRRLIDEAVEDLNSFKARVAESEPAWLSWNVNSLIGSMMFNSALVRLLMPLRSFLVEQTQLETRNPIADVMDVLSNGASDAVRACLDTSVTHNSTCPVTCVDNMQQLSAKQRFAKIYQNLVKAMQTDLKQTDVSKVGLSRYVRAS